MSKHNTDCFSGVTAEFISKTMSLMPRTLSTERMSSLHASKDLRLFLLALDKPEQYENVINYLKGHAEFIATGPFARVQSIKFSPLKRERMLKVTDKIKINEGAKKVLGGIRPRSIPELHVGYLDLLGELYEDEVIQSGKVFNKPEELSSVIRRLIANANRETDTTYLLLDGINRFTYIEHVHQVSGSDDYLDFSLRWEPRLSAWIIGTYTNGSLHDRLSKKWNQRHFFLK